MQKPARRSHDGQKGKIIPECGHEIIGWTGGFRLFFPYYITYA
jgi:hypothetical protein